ETWLSVVWWFHPVMWWLRRSLRRTREECCDDALVAGGITSPELYCETLIDAATSPGQRRRLSCHLEPLAMFFWGQEHPACRRIRRLMDDSVVRTVRVRRSSLAVTAMIALIFLPGIRVAQSARNPAQVLPTAANDSPKGKGSSSESRAGASIGSTNPKRIIGKVIDERGEPIRGAIVDGRVTCRQPGPPTEYKTLAHSQMISDQHGVFQIEVDHVFQEGNQLNFAAFISADHCFQRSFIRSGIARVDETIELPPFTLLPGRVIRGRVTGPTSTSPSPIDGSVSIRAKYWQPDGQEEHHFQHTACDGDGSFKLIVPSRCQLQLDASADNYATRRISREFKEGPDSVGTVSSAQDLGEIPLKKGVSVFGTARRRDGSPAAGVVVGILEGDPNEYPDVSASKTDKKGRFRLPPHLGKCLIAVVEQCRTRAVIDGEEQVINADGETPVFDTIVVDLENEQSVLELDLREAESIELSGAIRDVMGNPVSGLVVQAGWQTEVGLLEVAYLPTDEEGRYSIRVPKGRVPSLSIRNKFIDQDMLEPFLADPNAEWADELFSNASVVRNDALSFRAAEISVDDLDWVMIRSVPRPANLISQFRDFVRRWIFD
ncbi:MAG: hypothetical protein AAF989_04735, partial [Planctomycetota bacterium]